jgi:hypothetical protein
MSVTGIEKGASMRIRLSCLVLGVLLVPALVRADDHWADFYAAFSGSGGGSKLFGVHEAVAVTSPGSPRHYLSFVVSDVSLHSGSHDGTDVTQVTYLWGGRVTVSKPQHKLKPYFHGLLGLVTTDGVADGTNFAGAVGGGLEYLPSPTDRDRKKGFGIRTQIDRVFRSGDGEDFWRISGGIFYRFGQAHD